MLPSAFGSTAASASSWRQRSVRMRASALASPLTYLSNHAFVYQAISSAPRRGAEVVPRDDRLHPRVGLPDVADAGGPVGVPGDSDAAGVQQRPVRVVGRV